MKYRILAVGKIKKRYLQEGIAEYTKWLRPYGGVTISEVVEGKISDKPSSADLQKLLEDEGERLLKQVRSEDFLILLDLHGRMYSSEDFAGYLQELALAGHGEVVFAIGGAYGVGENIRERANLRISLGSWTYTHQMIRYLLTEQLYRAEKINRNEPYHW